jgi:hypothetical protein
MTGYSTESRFYALYIGRDASKVADALSAEGGWVYHADALMPALGMYITYMPQIVIIDTCASYAEDAYLHLRSVDAHPIILLTTPDSFKPTRVPGVHWLDRSASSADLRAFVCHLSLGHSPCTPSEYLDEALDLAFVSCN